MKKSLRPTAKTLWQLFLSTLYISAFTFGGGFVIVTFMKKKFVDELHWIDEDEMLDLTAIAQSSPGSIAGREGAGKEGERMQRLSDPQNLCHRRCAGHCDSRAGHTASPDADPVNDLVFLCSVRLQPIRRADAARHAGGRCGGNMRRSMESGRQGRKGKERDVDCDNGGLGSKVVKEHSALSIALMLCAFAATFFFKINVVFILLAAALVGAVKLLVIRLKEVRA